MKAGKIELFNAVVRETEAYLGYLKNAVLFANDDIFLIDHIRYCEEVQQKIKRLQTTNPDFAFQLFFAVESLRKYYQDMHWAEDDLFRDKCQQYLNRMLLNAKQLLKSPVA